MPEIHVGDKVKLKEDILDISIDRNNGRIYKTCRTTWKAGSIHTVKKIALGYVELSDIDTPIRMCNVEKVKDEEVIKIYRNPENNHEIIAEDFMNNRKVVFVPNSNIASDFYYVAKKAFDQLVIRNKFSEKESGTKEEPKKYYNGKIVCTEASEYSNRFTKGKIYEVIDGELVADNGNKTPAYGYFSNFKEIENWGKACKFIEVIE